LRVILRDSVVDFRGRRPIKTETAHVPYNPDNRAAAGALAHRVLAREILARQRFVDQGDTRRLAVVVLGEAAALAHGDAEGSKITGRHIAQLRHRLAGGDLRRPPLDSEMALPSRVLKRKVLDESGGA